MPWRRPRVFRRPWGTGRSTASRSSTYLTGDTPRLMQGMDYCTGDVETPQVDVPQVRRGAVLYGPIARRAARPRVHGPGSDTETSVAGRHLAVRERRSPGDAVTPPEAVAESPTR